MPGAAEAPKFWREIRRESPIGQFIPWSSLISHHDVITRGGDFLRIWRLAGICFECAGPTFIAERHEAKCALLRNLAGGKFALWEHRIHRRISDELAAPPRGFPRALDRAYKATLAREPMTSHELYLTVVYRPQAGEPVKAPRSRRDAVQVGADHAAALRVMDEMTALVERVLRGFDPQLLGIRTEGGIEYSEVCEFLSVLVNGSWRKVPLLAGPLYRQLPDVRLSFQGDKVELRGPTTRRYGALIDILEYPEVVEPGVLNPLLYEDSEFIESHSFVMLPRRDALKALAVQRNQLITSQDVVASQIAAMDAAINDVGDGHISMGEYHYSLMVFGNSAESAGRLGAAAAGALGESTAIRMVPVDLVSDAAWMAQWPGNWKWRTREAKISSRAYAALTSGHNFARGKRDGNPWGEALMILRTPSGQPFYFNLHVSSEKGDDEDKKLPGNTMVIGVTGSGKTTLIMTLLMLSQKFDPPPRLVVFDLDRGSEIALRALGGQYFAIQAGQPTGINPLQREPTGQRILFWETLVKRLIETPAMPLLPADERSIAEALRAVATMPRAMRRLSAVRQNLPRAGDNSLYDRLGRWCAGGALGWVFDEADDGLGDLKSAHVIGFDYTEFLDYPEVRGPLMMVLMDLMDDLIDGRRIIYVIDEFWKALADDYFAEFARTKQKTIRKQNGLGIFGTQSPSDVLKHANGRTLVEQSVTKICLPNPDAVRSEYVDGFGLTAAEYEIVKGMGLRGPHRFLVKQGHRSAVCQLDLSGLNDYITVLSGTTDNVALLDAIRTAVGDDPNDWIRPLIEQVRARSARYRRARP